MHLEVCSIPATQDIFNNKMNNISRGWVFIHLLITVLFSITFGILIKVISSSLEAPLLFVMGISLLKSETSYGHIPNRHQGQNLGAREATVSVASSMKLKAWDDHVVFDKLLDLPTQLQMQLQLQYKSSYIVPMSPFRDIRDLNNHISRKKSRP